MNKFFGTVAILVIPGLLFCAGSRTMAETPDRKVKVNLTAVRWKLQEPYLLLTSGSPVFRLFHKELEMQSYERAARDFPAEKLAKIFNVTGFSRERLLQISQINFVPEQSDKQKNGEITAVNVKERTVNIPLYTFSNPRTTAKEVVRGIAFIEYSEPEKQARIDGWLENYLRQCNQLERKRNRLLHEFEKALRSNMPSPLFKQEFLSYLSTRQHELETATVCLDGWKKILPPEIVDRSTRTMAQRRTRLAEIDKAYRNNSGSPVKTADRKYILDDLMAMSYSNISFYCNALDSMNYCYRERDYDTLYAMCMEHFFSIDAIRAGFSWPGYNDFRHEWLSAGMNPLNSAHEVSAGDFEIVFTDLPKPVNELYKCYLIVGMN
ncbi:MAG: hypothetical protein WCI51_12690 [Lentisphaerota bacterium]